MARGDVVVGAAFVPGFPHLLASEQAEPWKRLSDATREVGRWLHARSPDVVVVLSTQWFTVLGHQFQVDPNPRGDYVDENWYDFDFGHLSYDIPVDVDFTREWAEQTEAEGFQARLTRYDGFPIDTGTIVAGNLLDPEGRLPAALVSCNLYAPAEHLERIGAAATRTAERRGQRIAVIAISGLSSGLIQEWIEPHEDQISDPAHDRWNRTMLDLLARGDVAEVMARREDYAREAQVDSQFRAVAFLAGTGAMSTPAEVLEYGPIWGTGAAVLRWTNEE